MKYKLLELSKISLDLENPRHAPFENKREAIEYLCKEEKILALAKDIAKHGLNPLVPIAVVKKDDGSFICAEGNRRICALKLLNNPELAPTNSLKKNFEEARKEFAAWKKVKQQYVVEFEDTDEDHEEIKVWLDRIHAGENNGIGRRQWSSAQIARNSDDKKRKFALAVLEHGRKLGFVLSDDWERRMSTVKNWLNDPLMREVFGFNLENFPPLTTNLSDVDFMIVFKKFMIDVDKKQINTRIKTEKKNEKDVFKDYAKELKTLTGFTDKRLDKRSLASAGDLKIKKLPKPKKPTEPIKPKTVPVNIELEKALEQLDNYKLKNIYYSLCEIELLKHTPLLYVVAWVFIETLTAECGRNNSEDGRGGSAFPNYLNKKMHDLSFGTSSGRKTIGQAVKFISERGNTTKHDKRVAGFNDLELVSNFQIIEPLLLALAKEAIKKQS